MGMGCYNISQTQSRQEKNEIFVETIGSTVAGAAASYGLALIFVATPVGWAAALTLGALAAAGSFGAGKGGRYVYDKFLNQHDLVKMTKIDRLCK